MRRHPGLSVHGHVPLRGSSLVICPALVLFLVLMLVSLWSTPLYAQTSNTGPDDLAGDTGVTTVLLAEDFANRSTTTRTCAGAQLLPGWSVPAGQGSCWMILTPSHWNSTEGAEAFLAVGG